MSHSNVIQIENAGKAFPKYRSPGHRLGATLLPGLYSPPDLFWAVRGVNLQVGAGESIGIVGRNGSGKSTLLQMICGIFPPTEGLVRCEGRVAALLELGAGFNPDFTGRENIYLNAAMLGFDRAGIDERMEDILAFADIGQFIDEPVKTYSSGMFVRLAFSVAIHVDPRILVVDEALAVGDARFQAKCMKRIRTLQDDGATILFVAHDVTAVRALCQRALWLDSGKQRHLGPVFDVTARYMEHLFSDQKDEDLLQAPNQGLELQMPSAEAAADASADAAEDHQGPLNHWGSHIGTIRSITLRGERTGSNAVFEWGERVRLAVDFVPPENCDREHLVVAFSLKDLRGTDLMVGSSCGHRVAELDATGRVRVTFEFDMRLTPDRYLLVIAVEDRSTSVFEYYEYVEGAAYFAVTSDQRRFGVFNLPLGVTCESVPMASMTTGKGRA